MAKKLPEPTSDGFLRGYLSAALWASTDESDDSGGEPLDKNYSIEDISDEGLASAIKDCNKFIGENTPALEQTLVDDDQNGHDFWLTRNGHGTGFWDRDYTKGRPDSSVVHEVIEDILTESLKKFGEVSLYVGDNGKLYFS
jgi:hypothetical protein